MVSAPTWWWTLPPGACTRRCRTRTIDILGGDIVGVAAVAAIAVIVAFFLWRANKATAVEPHETISENPAFGSGASVGAGVTA
jgi:hypothetical protein